MFEKRYAGKNKLAKTKIPSTNPISFTDIMVIIPHTGSTLKIEAIGSSKRWITPPILHGA
jgi:hypothetical protein